MLDRWDERDIPSQSGRVAVVTGANGGLGLETARALAGAGAHVVMAARNLAKADDAAASLRAAVPDASIEVVPLDLGDLSSVAAAAETIGAAHPAIDLLVNNAGIMATPEGRTADGFELQLGTNHFGHFALTARLLPALVASNNSRIVTVTSVARLLGRSVPADGSLDDGPYDPWTAYSRSKLANVLFAVGLHQRLADAGASTASLLAHPGLTNTDLQATSAKGDGAGLQHRFWHAAARHAGLDPGRGALAQLRAATDPGARSGQLYGPRFGTFGSPVRRPLGPLAARQGPIDALWSVSERETGLAMDARAAVTRSRG